MRRLLFLVLLLAISVAVAAFSWRPMPEPREIVLVARDMAFTRAAPGNRARRNPPLGLRSGERIRLVVRNEDRGSVHDLVLEGIGLRTRVLKYGESDALVFQVPEREGTGWYACSFHTRMMRGRLVIQ